MIYWATVIKKKKLMKRGKKTLNATLECHMATGRTSCTLTRDLCFYIYTSWLVAHPYIARDNFFRVISYIYIYIYISLCVCVYIYIIVLLLSM